MLTEILIVLNRVCNRIQNILPHLEFCFEEHDEVFTIIRVNPYAILQSDKPDLAHNRTQLESHPSPSFWNIKSDHPPTTIPFLFLTSESNLRLFKLKCLVPSRCHAQIFLPIPFNPYYILLRHQTSDDRFHPILKVVLFIWQIVEKLKCVPCDRSKRHKSSHSNSGEHRMLDVLLFLPFPRCLF